MNTATRPLEDLIRKLSPHMQSEVTVFIESLLTTREKKHAETKLKQNWAGALRNCKRKHTSLELQHKVSQWRGL